MKKILFIFYIFYTTFSFNQVVLAQKVYDKVLVSVGEEAITQNQIELIANQAWKAQGKKGSPSAQFKKDILSSLINRSLLLNYARDNKLNVSVAEVKKKIESLQKRQDLSPEEFEQVLKKKQISLYAFQKQIQEDILYEKAVNYFILSHAVVSEEMVREKYEKPKQTKERRICHIFLVIPQGVDEEQIKNKAQKIYEQIQTTSDFNKAVQEYSQDEATKGNNGDLGFHSKEDLLKALQDPVFKAKKGSILPPIRSQVGYHIVFVSDEKIISHKTHSDFALKKAALMQQAQIQARQERLDRLLGQLKSEYLIEYK